MIRNAREASKRELYEQMNEIDADDALEREEDGMDQADDDIHFTVLIESLAEPLQTAYLDYGDTFRSGYLALNRGEFEIAVEDLTKAMKENPPAGYIPMELSTALVNLGRSGEAKPLLEEFIKHHPAVSQRTAHNSRLVNRNV
jgi:Flp pilus assembly protein TadD